MPVQRASGRVAGTTSTRTCLLMIMAGKQLTTTVLETTAYCAPLAPLRMPLERVAIFVAWRAPIPQHSFS